MKLSEAIRLGAMATPQGAGALVRGDRTCALGAALKAIGKESTNGYWAEVYDQWPIASRHVEYPGTEHHCETVMIGTACWLLNDADGWTRERIADWVEALEQAEAQTAAVPTADAVAV